MCPCARFEVREAGIARADLRFNSTGYNPDIHPGTSHVFEAAAFRYGHTQIPPGMYIG